MSVKAEEIIKKPTEAIISAGKEIIAPADTKGTSSVLLGAVASPVISMIYSKLYNMVIGKIPINIPYVKEVIRIILPLLPVFPVMKLKIPAGNLINGTLLGIFLTQILSLVFEIFQGKKSVGNLESGSGTISASDLSLSDDISELFPL